jgi:hypothetical protein
MFVAAMAVFVPGTLWAVDAFTNVAIEDPLTGTKASVNSARRLGVFGSVTATETSAANFYRFIEAVFPTDPCLVVATPPKNKALILKAIVLNTNRMAAPPAYNKYVVLFAGKSCASSSAQIVAYVNPPGIGVTTIPLDPGLGIPAGQSLWAKTYNISVDVGGTGYTVSAASVPASVAVSGSLTQGLGRRG